MQAKTMKTETEKDEIDNIKKYSQRARSPAPKRRTDFSLLCSSSCFVQSNPEEGSKAGWCDSSEGLSGSHITISNRKLDRQSEAVEWPADRCRNFKNGSMGVFQNSSDCRIKHVESVSSHTLPDSCDNRPKSDSLTAVESTSEKLQNLQNGDVCMTPRSAVCSETASQMSRAAKATKLRGHQKSRRLLFNSQDVASTSNKEAHFGTSNSSRRKADSLDSEIGQNNQKSNEVNPASSARRLRIMRYLGLAPPIGSPY